MSKYNEIEISEKDMLRHIEVEITKYERACPTCYYFDGKTCDMCAAGYPYAEDNNGKTPREVQRCDVYFDRSKATKRDIHGNEI
jgi:hypothetical protein